MFDKKPASNDTSLVSHVAFWIVDIWQELTQVSTKARSLLGIISYEE